jgi:hypothetical protein
MTHLTDPDGERLPIKLDATSNGEFVPVPLDATGRAANRLARRWASENAKRRGVSRRDFMVSACELLGSDPDYILCDLVFFVFENSSTPRHEATKAPTARGLEIIGIIGV